MGACIGSAGSPSKIEGKQPNRKFDKMLNEKVKADKKESDKIHKLLLLGAGESGKSTLFKQLINLHGNGFEEKDFKAITAFVFENTITSMKSLLAYAESNGFEITQESRESKHYLDHIEDNLSVTPELAEHITRLWKDPAIQKSWENRSRFQILESAEYFFERVGKMSHPGYVPSYDDMIRARIRSSGIVETTFHIGGVKFSLFDVGGQRNERKKWIHCFEGVTAVVFVVAISEYDQVCFEDEKTNRIVEAMNLFEEISGLSWFQETPIILFFNKKDLFEKKIRRTPISNFFPSYHGGDDPREAYKYFNEEFLRKGGRNKRKEFYVHHTCATDSNNVELVFNTVKDIVVQKRIEERGMI